MKNLIYLLTVTLISHMVFSQSSNSCVSCNNNVIDTTKNASAIGSENISTGLNSFASGFQSEATGDYSFAFGDSAIAKGLYSIALGPHAVSNEWYSAAIGRNCFANGGAFAFGEQNIAQAETSFLFGRFLKSMGGGSVTIGHGAGIGDDYLVNSKAYCLMVGFNSSVPTLYVGSSSGYGNTGEIGIGNMIDPQAKLHILGDDALFNEENASLFIQSAGNYFSYLWLGDKDHTIKAKSGSDFIFSTNDENFIFENGNIGVGAEDPIAKLQVKNGDIFIEDIDRGIVMKSPDGNCWRGTLNNNGSLHFVQVNCDDLLTDSDGHSTGISKRAGIYPNPAGDKVFVSIDRELTGYILEIVDINGNILFSEVLANNESYIDLSTYQTGVYLFNIKDSAGKISESYKIVKK